MTTKIETIQIPHVIQQTIMKSKDVKFYIAEDGKKFTNKEYCLIHETEFLRRLVEESDDIIKCHDLDDCAPFNGCDYTEDHCYRWFSPLNENGATLLYEAYESENIESPIDKEDFGKWFCIEFSGVYLNDTYWIKLDACVDYARNILSHLRNTEGNTSKLPVL